MRTGVGGCGFVVWFGKCTEIAFLDSLFGCSQPITARNLCKISIHAKKQKKNVSVLFVFDQSKVKQSKSNTDPQIRFSFSFS